MADEAKNVGCQYDAKLVKRLYEESERAGQMLIRRDLELTRANERLREIDKLKTDFISTATHQMRTPLAGIKWALGMLLNGDFGALAPDQELYIRKAYASTDRMIELLRDMLFAEQVGSGTFTATTMEASILDVFEALMQEMRPLAQTKQVRFEFIHAKAVYPTVRVSPEYIRAIFQNLLENAIKYTRAGGTVRLEIREETSERLLCVVSDTGIGIPVDAQKHMYERFFRAENAKKEITDGSGLGLYIAKELAGRAGGTIRFESTEGEGTTFYVELPLMVY